jgi:hypothetical protein
MVLQVLALIFVSIIYNQVPFFRCHWTLHVPGHSVRTVTESIWQWLVHQDPNNTWQALSIQLMSGQLTCWRIQPKWVILAKYMTSTYPIFCNVSQLRECLSISLPMDYNIGRQASSHWSYYPGSIPSSMAFKRWHPDCLIPSLTSSLVARMSEVSFCMHSSDGMLKCTHIDNLGQLTVLFSGTLWVSSFDYYYLLTHASK